MIRGLLLGAVAVGFLQSQSAFAAECRVGDRVTLTVLMQGDAAKTDDGWFYEGFAARPCTVSKILGKGRPPANCGDHKTLTATGIVEELPGPTLIVQSASCK